MSTAKKTTAKKTAKKTVKKTAARSRAGHPTAAAAAREVAESMTIDENGTLVAPAEADEDPVEYATVDVALSSRGERTGETHTMRVRRPSDTQLVWFEAAAHRFDLALEAWKEGAELAQSERGEVFNDALNAMNVFVATRHDRAWINQAMSSGILELDALIEAINAAKDALGLGEAEGADVVVA